jgi:hypothetical protein
MRVSEVDDECDSTLHPRHDREGRNPVRGPRTPAIAGISSDSGKIPARRTLRLGGTHRCASARCASQECRAIAAEPKARRFQAHVSMFPETLSLGRRSGSPAGGFGRTPFGLRRRDGLAAPRKPVYRVRAQWAARSAMTTAPVAFRRSVLPNGIHGSRHEGRIASSDDDDHRARRPPNRRPFSARTHLPPRARLIEPRSMPACAARAAHHLLRHHGRPIAFMSSAPPSWAVSQRTRRPSFEQRTAGSAGWPDARSQEARPRSVRFGT